MPHISQRRDEWMNVHPDSRPKEVGGEVACPAEVPHFRTIPGISGSRHLDPKVLSGEETGLVSEYQASPLSLGTSLVWMWSSHRAL